MSEPELPDAAALSRVVAVINGKGGVLKTSIVANVAGCLAKSMRVLVIDLDISGNLKMDLGMTAAAEDDAGKSVVDAVWSGADLQIVREVRPNLDMVFGGRALEMLSSLAKSSMSDELPTGSIATEFASRLADVAEDYDLVLLDCPWQRRPSGHGADCLAMGVDPDQDRPRVLGRAARGGSSRQARPCDQP